MCSEPISDEELWGDPDADQYADQVIEQLLEETEDAAGVNFDDAHLCPKCREPHGLCQCGVSDDDS